VAASPPLLRRENRMRYRLILVPMLGLVVAFLRGTVVRAQEGAPAT
jgi:hypothetical protein